jgi:hypothetical protein
MTVSELIAKLSEYNGDEKVAIYDGNVSWSPPLDIASIEFGKVYYDPVESDGDRFGVLIYCEVL